MSRPLVAFFLFTAVLTLVGMPGNSVPAHAQDVTRPPDAISDTSAPLDPGRDPEFETQRRQSGFGYYGLALPCYAALIAIVLLLLYRRTLSRGLIGVLLVIAATAGTIGTLEGLLRLTWDRWAIHVKIRSNCYYSNPRGYFVRSEMRGHPDIAAWCVDPLEVTWRTCENPPNAPGGFTIMALGDSFTDGVGVFRRDAWPNQMARLIAPGDSDTRVANCGRADHDPPRTLARYRDVTNRHNPDVVIYAMTLNDIPPDLGPQQKGRVADVSFQVEDRHAYLRHIDADPLWGPLSQNFALGRFLIERLVTQRVAEATQQFYSTLLDRPDRPGVIESFRAIDDMAALAKERGAKFLVVLWPMFYHLDSYPFAETHRRIREHLTRQRVASLDLLPLFSGLDAASLQVHPTDFHPNEKAHAMAASAILAELVRLGWYPPKEIR